jgi:anti-sigma B factor antagonist
MAFTTEERGDLVLVHASGMLTVNTAPELRDVVSGAIAAGGRKIAVDLSEVEFIDSSGLGALVGSLKAARQVEGDLRIGGASSQVLMVLKLTNLDRVLTPHESAADAFA